MKQNAWCLRIFENKPIVTEGFNLNSDLKFFWDKLGFIKTSNPKPLIRAKRLILEIL